MGAGYDVEQKRTKNLEG